MGGGTAALALRAAGFEGEVTVVCAEEHPPYSKPPLSKAVLRGEVGPERTHLRPARMWESKEIDLLLGRPATQIDTAARELELADGERLPYDALVLAPGSRPRTLPGADSDERIVNLGTIDDSLHLADRLAAGGRLLVIGAGFIGAEVASSARKLGCEVTVLEAAPAPLSRLLPPAVGAHYERMHLEQGVDLRLGCPVSAVAVEGDTVVVTDGLGGRHEAEVVLSAIGSVPQLELIEGAGLPVADGAVVDELCRTAVPEIFVVGDAANYPNAALGGRRVRIEHWQNAQHQAQAVAKTIAGTPTPFAEVPWVWSEQYDIQLQIAGIPAASDEVLWRGDPDAGPASALLLRDGRLAAVVGLDRPDDVQAVRGLIARGETPDRGLLTDADHELAAA